MWNNKNNTFHNYHTGAQFLMNLDFQSDQQRNSQDSPLTQQLQQQQQQQQPQPQPQHQIPQQQLNHPSLSSGTSSSSSSFSQQQPQQLTFNSHSPETLSFHNHFPPNQQPHHHHHHQPQQQQQNQPQLQQPHQPHQQSQNHVQNNIGVNINPTSPVSEPQLQLNDLSSFTNILESTFSHHQNENQHQHQHQHQQQQHQNPPILPVTAHHSPVPAQPDLNQYVHPVTQNEEDIKHKDKIRHNDTHHNYNFSDNNIYSYNNSQSSNDKRRKRVSRACLNCRKAHVACDHQRPCKRCAKLGLSDTCIDVPRRKRGPNKKSANKRARLNEAGDSSTIEFDSSLNNNYNSDNNNNNNNNNNTNNNNSHNDNNIPTESELKELSSIVKDLGGVHQVKKALERIRGNGISLTEEKFEPTSGPCISSLKDFLEVNTKFCKRAEPTVIWNSKQLSMVSCNKEFKELLGYENDSNFGPGRTTWSDVIHPTLMFRTLESYQASVNHGASSWERDIVCVNKKGEDMAFRILLNVTETSEPGVHNVVQRVTHVHDPATVPDIIRYILDFYHTQA